MLGIRRRGVLTALIAVIALVVPMGAAVATDSEVIHYFDGSKGELSEGVVVDKKGNVYVSLAPLGQLIKFTDGSGPAEAFGQIPGWAPDGEGAGLLGLAVDKWGHVYAAAQWTGVTGVWRFHKRTGEATRLPGTEQMTFPNSIVFSNNGTMFVTDSFTGTDADGHLGAVWKIRKNGKVSKWVESHLLGGTGALGLGVVGANGIGFHKRTIYVANTEKALIVSIPVLSGGKPGAIEVVKELPPLIIPVPGGDPIVVPGVPDGIEIDNKGRIYITTIAQHAIDRLNTDGSLERLAAFPADELDLPSSVALGVGKTRHTLYAVNLSLDPAFSSGVGPALLAIDLSD